MTRLSLLGLAAIVGCAGTNPNASAVTSSSDSATTAAVAATVAEPRRNDPTGAPPLSPATARPLAPSGAGAAAASASASTQGPAWESTEEPKRIGARHVLVQWMGSDRAGKSVLRTREQALVLAQEVLKRAKAGEDLGRLAVEYSDEPNAGARGGSLGRFGKGQMVGAFEAVAFKLKVGQISDIVETPFGYHIIQRTE
jgi:non-canonical (house-cleaning) NTP pyrophosphatase